MQLEAGKILEGKVTGITKYGAFVDVGGITGMVHISEVSSVYVKEISDYLKEGDIVKVKVLKVGEEGKVSLSIKQTEEAQRPQERTQQGRPPQARPFGQNERYQKPNQGHRNSQGSGKGSESSFEDMLSKFKQNSDEKMSDLKRFMDGKHGSYSKRSR